jgi:hypothetical protein
MRERQAKDNQNVNRQTLPSLLIFPADFRPAEKKAISR